jgi:hypothetical protein
VNEVHPSKDLEISFASLRTWRLGGKFFDPGSHLEPSGIPEIDR